MEAKDVWIKALGLRRAVESRHIVGKSLMEAARACDVKLTVLTSQDNGRDGPLGCLPGRAAHREPN